MTHNRATAAADMVENGCLMAEVCALDHVIVFGATGLQRVMTLYCRYYERSRTYLPLDKDARIPRPLAPASAVRPLAIPEVGRLHHRYERHAA